MDKNTGCTLVAEKCAYLALPVFLILVNFYIQNWP